MSKITLKGRPVIKGVVEGEAFVTKYPIAFCSGVDPNTGTISERLHPDKDGNFAGKILVLPSAKGSSAFSKASYACYLYGVAPIGVIVGEMNPQIAQGVITMRTPTVTELDQNPVELIATGDWVKIDGNTGEVEVTKKG